MKRLHHRSYSTVGPMKDESTRGVCHLMDRRVHCNIQQTRFHFRVLMMSEKVMVQSIIFLKTPRNMTNAS